MRRWRMITVVFLLATAALASGENPLKQPPKLIQEFHAGTRPVRALHLNQDGSLLMCSDSRGTVRIVEVASGRVRKTFEMPRADFCTSLSLGPKARYAAVGGSRTGLTLFDAKTGKPILIGQWEIGDAKEVTISPDGKLVAGVGMGRDGDQIKVWDIARDDLISSKMRGSRIRFSPDGKKLGLITARGGFELWQVRPEKKLKTLKLERGSRSRWAFSPDGKRILIYHGTSKIDLFDLATAKKLKSFRVEKRGNRSFSAVSFHSGGTRVVAISYQSLYVWDIASGKLVLQRHAKFTPYAPRFAADGSPAILQESTSEL